MRWLNASRQQIWTRKMQQKWKNLNNACMHSRNARTFNFAVIVLCAWCFASRRTTRPQVRHLRCLRRFKIKTFNFMVSFVFRISYNSWKHDKYQFSASLFFSVYKNIFNLFFVNRSKHGAIFLSSTTSNFQMTTR